LYPSGTGIFSSRSNISSSVLSLSLSAIAILSSRTVIVALLLPGRFVAECGRAVQRYAR
jgi:hypothetical protein